MTYVLVKLTCDLYAPGAVIRPKEMEWIFRWDKFHSRRIIYPTKDIIHLAFVEDGVFLAKEDFCHIRISSMDGAYGGVMDSELDYSLAGTTLEVLLGNRLALIANKALQNAPPYNPVHRTHTAWLELWDAKTLESVCDINFRSIVELCKK
jgi:hypothetical protein